MLLDVYEMTVFHLSKKAGGALALVGTITSPIFEDKSRVPEFGFLEMSEGRHNFMPDRRRFFMERRDLYFAAVSAYIDIWKGKRSLKSYARLKLLQERQLEIHADHEGFLISPILLLEVIIKHKDASRSMVLVPSHNGHIPAGKLNYADLLWVPRIVTKKIKSHPITQGSAKVNAAYDAVEGVANSLLTRYLKRLCFVCSDTSIKYPAGKDHRYKKRDTDLVDEGLRGLKVELGLMYEVSVVVNALKADHQKVRSSSWD